MNDELPTSELPWPPAEADRPAPHPQAPGPGTKLDFHYEGCFACGDLTSGLRMQTVVGEQARVHSQFTVSETHQGAPGLAHGGLLACAFDEALGAAVGNLLRQPAVTGRLETDFVRPVPVGSTLFITAKLDGISGRKIYASAEGRLDAGEGPVAVRARALFVQVGFEHFARHGGADVLKKLRDPAKGSWASWEINP